MSIRRQRIALRLALIGVLLVAPVWGFAFAMHYRDSTLGSLG